MGVCDKEAKVLAVVLRLRKNSSLVLPTGVWLELLHPVYHCGLTRLPYHWTAWWGCHKVYAHVQSLDIKLTFVDEIECLNQALLIEFRSKL